MKTTAFLLLVSMTGLTLLSGCGKPSVPAEEQANYGSVRDQVVHQVKTGQIKPDNDGFAILPPGFESASVGGQVIASQTPVTGWVVAFPLQQGRAHIQCLLYIEKTAPPAGQLLRVGSLSITMGNETDEHWYQGVLVSK